jgi:acylglycerol lipase
MEKQALFVSRKTRLSCTMLQPTKAPRAVVLTVHGLGEHKGRYQELASIFVEKQIAVFSFDHRGHGQSDGRRGHARSIDQLVEDLEQVLMQCRSNFLDIPIFLLGHSMGGLIVASFIQKDKSKEVAGALISSPWIAMTKPPPSWQIEVVHALSRVFAAITISNGLNPEWISGVADEVKKYIEDPLIHGKISLALLSSAFAKGKMLLENAPPAKIPIMLCHGADDQITDPNASARYCERLGDNATYHRWEKSRHEPHHDLQKQAVMQFYVEWVLDHLH